MLMNPAGIEPPRAPDHQSDANPTEPPRLAHDLINAYVMEESNDRKKQYKDLSDILFSKSRKNKSIFKNQQTSLINIFHTFS